MVTEDTNGYGFVGILQYKQVEERIFNNSMREDHREYRNIYDGFVISADMAEYSPTHSHLYLINENKRQLVVYDLSKEYRYKVKRSDIDNNTANGEEMV